jgi:dTDP-glucose 4,6-dehydratase
MKILLTGAAGFVGSHVLAHLLANTDADIVCPWTLRHHGNSQRLAAAIDQAPTPGGWNHRVTTVMHDLATPMPRTLVDEIGPVDAILNIASESGVEHSIARPAEFVRNNVELMTNLLEYARLVQPRVFLHMDTDEVYGPAPAGYAHREWDPIIPSNPYAASKAAQSALATAWWRTYGLPVILTRTMNLIGPGQGPEKLVPTVIRKVIAGETVPIYASTDGVPGSRHWIDTREFAGAWLHLLNTTTPDQYPDHDRPALWHIVGEERSNLEVAQTIADIIGKPLKHELVSFHAARPGHDLRYALDGSKLASAGWKPSRSLEETLTDIVTWYMDHPEWLRMPEAQA